MPIEREFKYILNYTPTFEQELLDRAKDLNLTAYNILQGYLGQVFAGCICYGDDMDKKIYMSKSEKGVKVRFGKGWDPENIEMLLEVLRSKRG